MKPDSRSSSDWTRRDVVSMMALAGAAVPFAGFAVDAAAQTAASPPSTPTCIHALSKPLQWLSYAALAELMAETGYGGIDYTVRPGGHVVPERVADDLPRAVELARKAGLKVEMITTAIVDPADPNTETILKTAASAGVKYYRMGYLAYDGRLGIEASLQKHRAAMKGLAELNRTYTIHGAYQNHAGGRVGGPVWDVYELLRDLDPRWIGCQYDVRHAVIEGFNSWPVGFRLLHPWIKCTDFKDFTWVQSAGGKWSAESVPAGEGAVDFDTYFKLVSELRVAGPISVHFEYPPFERATQALSDAENRRVCAAAMRKDLAVLKGYLAKYQIA